MSLLTTHPGVHPEHLRLKLCSQLARGRGALAVHARPNQRSAFHKKQQSESYLARATPSSTNFLTPPVKVTGMYADTCLIRAENSNMLEVPFRRVSIRMAYAQTRGFTRTRASCEHSFSPSSTSVRCTGAMHFL